MACCEPEHLALLRALALGAQPDSYAVRALGVAERDAARDGLGAQDASAAPASSRASEVPHAALPTAAPAGDDYEGATPEEKLIIAMAERRGPSDGRRTRRHLYAQESLRRISDVTRWAEQRRAGELQAIAALKRGIGAFGRLRASCDRPRERRGVARRAASSGSRAGPSDSAKGDGEGPHRPPSPASLQIAPARWVTTNTNSRNADTSCPPCRVGDHGIDTVAFGWRDAGAVLELRTLATERRPHPATGRPVLGLWEGRALRLSESVYGATVIVYPAASLVKVEGRLATLLGDDGGGGSLVSPRLLVHGARKARAAVESLGVSMATRAQVQRLDLAAELLFFDGQDGLAFLKASQRGLHLPALVQVPHYATGDSRLESIIWRTPKGRQERARLYDAGAHHGTHRAGERLRFEVQERWTGTHARTPEQVAALDEDFEIRADGKDVDKSTVWAS